MGHILKNNFENFCKLFCQIKVSLNVIMKTLQGLGRSLILLNIVLFIQTISGQIGSVQRCFDEQCQIPISEGQTVLKYHANSNSMLSFRTNQKVLIFSKGEGSQQDIWGVEINGKRGFVNRRHLQETRVKERNLGYVAPPHYTYYEMQLGGPDAAAHMQNRQQQMQGQEGPEVAAQQHNLHHHGHSHSHGHGHSHSHQHQEHEQQPQVLPSAPHPSAQQQPEVNKQPTGSQEPSKASEDPDISQTPDGFKQPSGASEPKVVEKVEPALLQPEANLQQQQQPKLVDSTGASSGTGNDLTNPAALPPMPSTEDSNSDQNIASTGPKISESATENEETTQKILADGLAEVTNSQQPPEAAADEQVDELNNENLVKLKDEQPIEDSPEQPLDEVTPGASMVSEVIMSSMTSTEAAS